MASEKKHHGVDSNSQREAFFKLKDGVDYKKLLYRVD
jgi:hypothetical protein